MRDRAWQWCLVLLVLPSLVLGQYDLNAYVLGRAEGLPSEAVYSITEDGEGRICVGHGAGLSRYNGSAFDLLEGPGVDPSLSGLVPLGKNGLLLRNFSGRVMVSWPGVLQPLEGYTGLRPGFPFHSTGGDLRLLYWEDLLWGLDTSGKAALWMDGGGRMRFYNVVAEDKEHVIAQVQLGDARSALLRLGRGGKEVDTLVNDLPPGRMQLLRQGREIEGIQGESGLRYRLEVGGMDVGRYELDLPAGTKVTEVLLLPDGCHLVGTFAGLRVYGRNWEPLGHYLKAYAISCLHLCANGSLWVGTLQDGLLVVPDLGQRLVAFRGEGGRPRRLSASLALPDGGLVVGSYDGSLIWLDSLGNVTGETALGKMAEVQSLCLDTNKGVVYAYCDGLQAVSYPSGKLLGQGWPVTSTKVMALRDQVLYCGSSRGLYMVSGDSLEGYLEDEWILDMAFDGRGRLLLLTRKGLGLWDVGSRQLLPTPPTPTGVPADGFRRVHGWGGKSGELLLLAPGHGLYVWDGEALEHYLGLPTEAARSGEQILDFAVLEGRVVLVGSEGLWLDADGWRPYRRAQGVPLGSLRRLHGVVRGRSLGAVLQGHGSDHRSFRGEERAYWYAVGGAEVLRYPLGLWGGGEREMRLVVREVGGTFHALGSRLVSEHGGNRLELEVELLGAVNGPVVGLEYCLGEGEGNWVAVPRNASGRYALVLERLPYGEELLRLRGGDAWGQVTVEQHYVLSVDRPYWARWWFVLLVVGGVVTLGYLGLRWRVRRLQRRAAARLAQAQLEAQALSAELRAIRSQMNPHFIFNTLSAIQSKVLEADSLSAYDDLSTFAKLLRAALDYSRREFLSLEEEMEFLRTYLHLEATRMGGALDWKVEVAEGLEHEGWRIPSLLTQPFVENAIRHGLLHQTGRKQLRVEVDRVEDCLLVVILDNGIGRAASAALNAQRPERHRSFATEAIAQRIVLLAQGGGPRVRIETSDLAPGTAVKIYICPNGSDDHAGSPDR